MRVVNASLILASLTLAGCGLVDPARPVPYPDEPIFGNLLEVEAVPGQPAQLVRIRAGVPRALSQAKEAERRPTPELEKGTVAEVQVVEDTIVVAGGRAADLKGFNPGTEVVALPLAGTTTMVGESTIRMTASHLFDFETYRRWRLPGLGGETAAGPEPEALRRISSGAIESSPVPLQGGRVLYFSSRLRLPVAPGQPLIGPPRPGLAPAAEGESPPERPFRAELSASGWSEPQPVTFPGLEGAAVVRVSWVNEEETVCLVTVRQSAEPPWVGRSTRDKASAPWGAVERFNAAGEGYSEDATYLAGSKTKLTFVIRAPASVHTDLVLLDPKLADAPQLLAPNINTAGDEWCPRVGPAGQLFFCRGDRQLLLAGGTVAPLLLPGPNRRMLTQANPTRDGKWVFFCAPNWTPVELDEDIYVAPWLPGTATLGEPVPVDDWRP
jgi:hypothetical protein